MGFVFCFVLFFLDAGTPDYHWAQTNESDSKKAEE